jgi:hypothetical protein
MSVNADKSHRLKAYYKRSNSENDFADNFSSASAPVILGTELPGPPARFSPCNSFFVSRETTGFYRECSGGEKAEVQTDSDRPSIPDRSVCTKPLR